uniref:U3 small nucleolar RNA-interacting protein 2 n=1 Tax=Myxine glutinosa TaxID=7769 RepID=UPI00358FE331
MSFFIKGKKRGRGGSAPRGRKRKIGGTVFGKPQNGRNVGQGNEEVSSESENEGGQVQTKVSEEPELQETAQEKRLRLTKLYLEQLRKEEEEKAENDDVHKDAVADRLQEHLMEQRGCLKRLVAKEIHQPDPSSLRLLRGHKLAVTCLVITPADTHIISGSKDGAIVKWNVQSGKKVCTIAGLKKGDTTRAGHHTQVLCMAISSDGKYLVSGDKAHLIQLWDAETCRHLHMFKGHKDAISGLSFRKGTHQLYSASHDRSVKVWNVNEMAYVETLFGHQDAITGLDSLSRERCVTSGGRDGTLRVWKILEESQLVFQAPRVSIDCVQLINEMYMVSGDDDGSLMLWNVQKKKPLVTVPHVHGSIKGEAGQMRWVTSVAALLNSDLIASGSYDGFLRLWKCGDFFKSLVPILEIELAGFINALKFSSDGKFLVAGVGQEHRLGRWWRHKDAKNGVFIIPLPRELPQTRADGDEARESDSHNLPNASRLDEDALVK